MGELYCLVLLAAARKEEWRGKLVLYVTDNENARIWLSKRRANNRLARYGLRLLQRMETEHAFQVLAAGVWTKRNLTMDLTTRATKQVIREEMGRLGLQEIDLLGAWRGLLLESQSGRPLALPGESGEGATAARQLVALRRPVGPPQQPRRSREKIGLRVLEWRAAVPTLALAWERRGATVWATPALNTPASWSEVCQVTWASRGAIPEVEVICAALAPDETGVEAR